MALPAVVGALVLPLLAQAIRWLSPVARELLRNAIRNWYSQCLLTPSSWDDVAAKVIAVALAIAVSDITSDGSGPGTIPEDIVDTFVTGASEVLGRPFDVAHPISEIGGT